MAEEDNRESGLFREVTPMGVIAPALAAATSFSLISRIGLVGSLIGTVVTAALTAVATQVYKNMMADSADRLKQIAPIVTGDIPDPDAPSVAGTPRAEGDTPATDGADIPDKTVALPVAADLTARLGPADAPTDASATRVLGATTPVASEHAQQVAAAHRARQAQRKVAIFSGVLAIVVALVVGGVILALTAGRGIGPGTVEQGDATAATSEAGMPGGTDAQDGAEQTTATDGATAKADGGGTGADAPADTQTNATSGDKGSSSAAASPSAGKEDTAGSSSADKGTSSSGGSSGDKGTGGSAGTGAADGEGATTDTDGAGGTAGGTTSGETSAGTDASDGADATEPETPADQPTTDATGSTTETTSPTAI